MLNDIFGKMLSLVERLFERLQEANKRIHTFISPAVDCSSAAFPGLLQFVDINLFPYVYCVLWQWGLEKCANRLVKTGKIERLVFQVLVSFSLKD